MSSTGSLTKFYGSFFWKCGEFALCPYLLTLNAFKNSKTANEEDLVLGVAACVFFSTVVPILPAIASLTIAIGLIGACCALVSMFFSYPIALISDAFRSSTPDNAELSCAAV